MCFQHIHCSIVTFLLTPTSRNCCQLSFNPCIWRYGTSFSSNNTNFSVPLESMTAPIHCFAQTTNSTCNTSLLSVSSVHFKSLEISAPHQLTQPYMLSLPDSPGDSRNLVKSPDLPVGRMNLPGFYHIEIRLKSTLMAGNPNKTSPFSV